MTDGSGWLLGLTMAATFAASTPASATTLEGKLVHVRDADTIEIATSRGQIAIRLNGVDGPELDTRGGRAGRDWMLRTYGNAILRCELTGAKTYDRWVATCFDKDGMDVGAAVVSAGHARDCPRFSGGRYAQYETEASRSFPLARFCR